MGQPDFLSVRSLLLEVVHYKYSLQLFSLGIFSEVNCGVGKYAVQAQVLTFEYCGLGSTLDFADLVNRFFRHYKMARNQDGYRVEPDGMGNGTYSSPVVAELCEIAVADQPGFS